MRRAGLVAAAPAAAMLALAACSGGGGSTDGCLCGEDIGDLVTQSTLVFGNVPLGATATLNLELRNAGVAELDVLRASITGDTTGSFAVSAEASPGVIAIGATATLTVTFTPTSVGPFTAQLLISNNGETSVVTVDLAGTGISAACTCRPASVSFGDVPIDASTPPTQVVTCANSSDAGCALSIDSADTDQAFQVTDVNGPVSPDSGPTLLPDASYALTVTFVPSLLKSYSSSFTVQAAEGPLVGAGPPQTVLLSGTAVVCQLDVTPTPILFSSTETTQTVAVTNVGPTAAAVTCVSLASVADCGAASDAFSFAGLPAFPAELAPSTSLAFALTATGADAGDTLDVSCLLAGTASPTSFTAPIVSP